MHYMIRLHHRTGYVTHHASPDPASWYATWARGLDLRAKSPNVVRAEIVRVEAQAVEVVKVRIADE